MAEKRLEESSFTSISGAVEGNPLRELETEQIRQLFRSAKSTQIRGNAGSRFLGMFHRVFDELATAFSFVLTRAYLPLIVSSGSTKKKAGPIFGALETSLLN